MLNIETFHFWAEFIDFAVALSDCKFFVVTINDCENGHRGNDCVVKLSQLLGVIGKSS